MDHETKMGLRRHADRYAFAVAQLADGKYPDKAARSAAILALLHDMAWAFKTWRAEAERMPRAHRAVRGISFGGVAVGGAE